MSSRNKTRQVHDLDLRDCETRLIWAREGVVEPQYLTGKSRAGERTVCWEILQGAVRVFESGTERSISSGHWFLPGSGVEKHAFEPGTELYSIHFHFRMRGGDPVFPRGQSLCIPVSESQELHSAAGRLIREVRDRDEGRRLYIQRGTLPLHTRFQIESALYHWMSAYTRVMRRQGQTIPPAADMDPRVAVALMLIEDHPMQEKFREKDLARKCGLSVNQMIRLFKIENKITPYEYYERRREELARQAVSETLLPLKEIFFSLGFGSSSHFSRWFSARTGLSPSRYRKNSGPFGEGNP